VIRVLLDTNVVLDLILQRAGFVEDADAIFQAQDRGQIEVYVSAITPGTVYYVARRIIGSAVARQAVADLLSATRVCTVDQRLLQEAVGLPLADYEDAIQLASALAERLDIIVTRDSHDFKNISLPVFSPKDFLVNVTLPTNGRA
jgi:predicted nucleic acid-binding protein